MTRHATPEIRGSLKKMDISIMITQARMIRMDGEAPFSWRRGKGNAIQKGK